MEKSISVNWKFILNKVAMENEKSTMSESKTNTSHLERKRFEYVRMKEDFVILLSSSKKNQAIPNIQNYQLYNINYLKFIKRLIL